MKHLTKKLLLIGLALGLTATLAGCDNPFADPMLKDSQVYIQGKLDTYYHGGVVSEDYLKVLDMTAEEVTAEYEEGLAVEAEYFMEYFGIEAYSDEMLTEAAALYGEVYTHSKYTVKPATALEDGNYVVTVEVEPINLMALVTEEEYTAADTAVFESFGLSDEDIAAMSEADTEALLTQYDADLFAAVVELVRSHMGEISYGETKSVAMQIQSDDGENYSLVGDDFSSLDALIIAY